MVSSDRNLANAVGGKTARACDNCIRKRARWYCAADDAFLCHSCDSSVHSANPLARRHERVRLKISSLKTTKEISLLQISVPSWHHGFTRKARTPRGHGKSGKSKLSSDDASKNPTYLVPEICSEENSHEETEEHLLYRVPVFEPFVAELCTSANSNDAVAALGDEAGDEIRNGSGQDESRSIFHDYSSDLNRYHGLLPSETELAEFAADVESLLGKGLDEESFDIEGLGLMSCSSKDNDQRGSMDCCFINEKVKVEDNDQAVEIVLGLDRDDHEGDAEIDMARDSFELKFDYDSPTLTGEDNYTSAVHVDQEMIFEEGDEDCKSEKGKKVKKKVMLSLDYDGVRTAWADQKSPWTTGERPEFDADSDCWPLCMGACGTIHPYGDHMGMITGHSANTDGGREARVSRYREKRRKRLFSKKIRYEVRKLNAEKRPRMKGRFVKRANFAAPVFPLLSNK